MRSKNIIRYIARIFVKLDGFISMDADGNYRINPSEELSQITQNRRLYLSISLRICFAILLRHYCWTKGLTYATFSIFSVTAQ